MGCCWGQSSLKQRSLAREIPGLHLATRIAQRVNANQATAPALATVITLANELRAALVEKGVIKGGPQLSGLGTNAWLDPPRLAIRLQ